MAKKLTKAQKVQAEAEVRETAVRAALAWPDYPDPPRLSDETIRERTSHLTYAMRDAIPLWTYNAFSGRVTLGCVGGNLHSPEGKRPTSQTQGGPWFDTQEDAYRALRWAVTRRLAEELLTLDEHMSRELADGAQHDRTPD